MFGHGGGLRVHRGPFSSHDPSKDTHLANFFLAHSASFPLLFILFYLFLFVSLVYLCNRNTVYKVIILEESVCSIPDA